MVLLSTQPKTLTNYNLVPTDLSKYDNTLYNHGAGIVKRILWHFVNHLVFTNGFIPISRIKVFLLRIFGAKIGNGVNIKPSVNIKYPWKLIVGDYVWIGEKV